jgi:hypothetical protein
MQRSFFSDAIVVQCDNILLFYLSLASAPPKMRVHEVRPSLATFPLPYLRLNVFCSSTVSHIWTGNAHPTIGNKLLNYNYI